MDRGRPLANSCSPPTSQGQPAVNQRRRVAGEKGGDLVGEASGGGGGEGQRGSGEVRRERSRAWGAGFPRCKMVGGLHEQSMR